MIRAMPAGSVSTARSAGSSRSKNWPGWYGATLGSQWTRSSTIRPRRGSSARTSAARAPPSAGVVHINGCVQGLVRSAHAIQFHRGTVDTPGRGALHQDGNPAGITSGPARIVNGNKRPRAAQHIKQMQTFVGLPGSGVRSLWA